MISSALVTLTKARRKALPFPGSTPSVMMKSPSVVLFLKVNGSLYCSLVYDSNAGVLQDYSKGISSFIISIDRLVKFGGLEQVATENRNRRFCHRCVGREVFGKSDFLMKAITYLFLAEGMVGDAVTIADNCEHS